MNTLYSDNNPACSEENILLGAKIGLSLLDGKHLDVLMQLPLPGITIFVHGVNSDGEWYKQAEEGLCKGLNQRLKRCDEHMAHPTPEGGQLRPATYLPELTPDGYINPDLNHKTFVSDEGSFSPVIQFRWGYKASSEELQKYGDSIYLNEADYWGGGPFANGCTSLPDLWSSGIDDTLFLWLHVQHINPTNDRLVYSCPPRAYYVLAALRLAKLIGAIRARQADTPVTIVCHSQGNMVAMAAAFLGKQLKPVTDPLGKQGDCIADTYVLCNPPYSLVKDNKMQSWVELGMKDPEGNGGRQTADARRRTLAAFFDIIRKRAATQQSAQYIDTFIKNELQDFDAQSDRNKYGYGAAQATVGRVTLYFNPHDQVISASTIQGIGWRGMSEEEISATRGAGVFSQRVFAQGFDVGTPGHYDFWNNQHNQPKRKQDYWLPASPPARYSFSKGLKANTSIVGKVMTFVTAPLLILATRIANTPINAVPPDDWRTPLTAPPLAPFKPQGSKFGQATDAFDEGINPPGEARDKNRQYAADDPYGGNRPLPGAPADATSPDKTDAPKGDRNSEAALRYEHHAMLRMEARREGRYGKDKKVDEEDNLALASDGYKSWRSKKIKDILAASIDTHATDHSTIMTNSMHAEKALAYDVAVGVCHLSAADFRKLRVFADWRFLESLEKSHPIAKFWEYFDSGLYQKQMVQDWAIKAGHEGSMPTDIFDKRAFFGGADK